MLYVKGSLKDGVISVNVLFGSKNIIRVGRKGEFWRLSFFVVVSVG